MVNEIIDAEKCNQALALIKSIREVPNTAYQENQKKRKSWVPVKGSIVGGVGIQPSLSEQEKPEYQRYEMDALLQVRDICESCHDMSDCGIAGMMRTLDEKDGCWIVKRNMELKK